MASPRRRLPRLLGLAAGLLALLLIGPVALAVALMRSSPEAAGAHPAAQAFIAFLAVAGAALVGCAVWLVSALVLRLLGKERGP